MAAVMVISISMNSMPGLSPKIADDSTVKTDGPGWDRKNGNNGYYVKLNSSPDVIAASTIFP